MASALSHTPTMLVGKRPLQVHKPAPTTLEPLTAPPRRVEEAPLPRAHLVASEPPVESSAGFMHKVAAFFRQHERPVAAVMAGASALPAIVGVAMPSTAHAAPLDPEGVELARDMLFGEAKPSVTPPKPKTIDRGTAALLSLREALIRHAFEPGTLRGPGPQPIDPTPVPQADKDVASSAIRAIDALLTKDAKLPSGLVSDLEKLRAGVEKAPVGELSKALDTALSGTSKGLSDAVRGVNGAAPNATRILAAYSGAVSGLEGALPSIPGTKLTLPFAATVPFPGGSATVPAGTVVSSKAGGWTLDAPSLLVTRGTTTVSAGRSTIALGGGADALSLETLKVTDGASRADLSGVGATIDRKAGTSTITADSAILELSAGHLELKGAKLSTAPGGAAALEAQALSWAKGGDSASFADLDVALADGALHATSGAATLTKGGSVLRAATLTLDSSGDSSTLEAAGVSLLAKDGTVASAEHGRVSVASAADGSSTITLDADALTVGLAKGGGAIAVDHGSVTASYGKDGALQKLVASGDHVSYSGEKSGHSTEVELSGAKITVTPAKGGGQDLHFGGAATKLVLDGHTIDVAGAHSVDLRTDAQGNLQKLDASFPGQISFEQEGGDLKVVVSGLEAHGEGSRLSARFDEATVRLESEGLTATLRGGSASLAPGSLRAHVDSLDLSKDVGTKLSAHVDGVDLVLDKSPTGAIGALDLKVAGFDAHLKGYDIFGSTKDGQRIRLHVEADATGKLIREAYLQIPTGGEIKIEKKDLSITLGPQTFTLVRDDSGAYTVGAKDLNVDVKLKDASVRIDGGSAKVKLDPASGALVIEEVHGTKVDVKAKGITATVDIQKLDGYLFKLTGVKGAGAGASIRLVPTSDASRIDLTIHANVKGLPIVLDLAGLHAFEATASMANNQGHVYLGDPSGHGTVKLGLGPLEMKGSAIEVFARYQTYDTGRMVSLVNRYLTTDGLELVRGVSIEPDGVVRLGTRADGVKAELAVLLPRGTGATPLYLLDAGDGAKDGAGGFVLSLGGQGTTGAGTTHAVSAFAGLVPGSYVDWRMTQGHMSILGVVPLPDEMRIPSTAIGGLSYERKTEDSRLAITAGAYVNPAGLVKAPGILEEPTPYGVFGGVHLKTKRVDLGIDGLVDLDAGGKAVGGGGRLMLGVSF